MKAQMPPFFWASATQCSASVVLPEDSGPKISTMRPRGNPPIPSATSSPSEPEEIASISILSLLPSFMTEPLPNCRSIWESAADRALDLSMDVPSTIRRAGWDIGRAPYGRDSEGRQRAPELNGLVQQAIFGAIQRDPICVHYLFHVRNMFSSIFWALACRPA